MNEASSRNLRLMIYGYALRRCKKYRAKLAYEIPPDGREIIIDWRIQERVETAVILYEFRLFAPLHTKVAKGENYV